MKIRLKRDVPLARWIVLKEDMICEVIEMYNKGVEAQVCTHLWISKDDYEVIDEPED